MLQYFQPLLSYHLSLRTLFCLFLVAALHRFTVYMKLKASLKPMARIENNLAEMFNKHYSMPQVKNISKIS